MRASASFNFDDGIRTSSWNAMFALRTRVNMSAIGSVIVTVAAPLSRSPRRLRDAGDLACMCHLPEADPAQPEVAVHRTRPAATATARVRAHFELRRALRFQDQSFLRHSITPGRRGGMGNRAPAT